MSKALTPLVFALLALGACRQEPTTLVEVDRIASPEGPVVDAAQVLSPAAESKLDKQLRAYWDSKATAIVVSTTDSLGGRTIEEYARDEYRAWGIGSAETNRGVLILVAPNERQARIEVGCGLETVLTDTVAQDVIDRQLIPAFRTADYSDGIAKGVAEIKRVLDESKVEPGPVSPYCRELMREAA